MGVSEKGAALLCGGELGVVAGAGRSGGSEDEDAKTGRRRVRALQDPFKTVDDGTTNDAEDADDRDDFTSRAQSGSLKGESSSSSAEDKEYSPTRGRGEN